MSRTLATENAYAKRVSALVNAYLKDRKACGGVEPPRVQDVFDWLIARKPALAPSTWRQYKAALIAGFSHAANTSGNPEYRDQIRACVERLRLESQSGTLRGSRRTSAGKSKRVDDPTMDRILAVLHTQSGRWTWAELTERWLRASLLTGLRPSEWQGSQWIETAEGAVILRVRNGKHSNGRANGEFRHLQLAPNRLDTEELEVVHDLVADISRLTGEMPFPKIVRAVRTCLDQACRRAFPQVGSRQSGRSYRRICLYSCRHQFTADAKSSGLSREEVAALLGHATDLTAGRHYARRTSGRSSVAITPDANEVARVRQHPKASRAPADDLNYRA